MRKTEKGGGPGRELGSWTVMAERRGAPTHAWWNSGVSQHSQQRPLGWSGTQAEECKDRSRLECSKLNALHLHIVDGFAFRLQVAA